MKQSRFKRSTWHLASFLPLLPSPPPFFRKGGPNTRIKMQIDRLENPQSMGSSPPPPTPLFLFFFKRENRYRCQKSFQTFGRSHRRALPPPFPPPLPLFHHFQQNRISWRSRGSFTCLDDRILFSFFSTPCRSRCSPRRAHAFAEKETPSPLPPFFPFFFSPPPKR